MDLDHSLSATNSLDSVSECQSITLRQRNAIRIIIAAQKRAPGGILMINLDHTTSCTTATVPNLATYIVLSVLDGSLDFVLTEETLPEKRWQH